MLVVFPVALINYWENRKLTPLKYHFDLIEILYIEIEARFLVKILYTG